MAAKTVDEYQANLTGWQQQALIKLRQIIREAAPEAVEKYKWAQPVYEHHGPFAYIKAFKNSINFGFWRGVDLVAPAGTLHGDGERMRHVVLTRVEDIEPEQLAALVRQASALNVQKGDPTKG
jgi:hypothetical protein